MIIIHTQCSSLYLHLQPRCGVVAVLVHEPFVELLHALDDFVDFVFRWQKCGANVVSAVQLAETGPWHHTDASGVQQFQGVEGVGGQVMRPGFTDSTVDTNQ